MFVMVSEQIPSSVGCWCKRFPAPAVRSGNMMRMQHHYWPSLMQKGDEACMYGRCPFLVPLSLPLIVYI